MFTDPRHIDNAMDDPTYRAACAEVIAALLDWYSEDGATIVTGRTGPSASALIFDDDATLGEHLAPLL